MLCVVGLFGHFFEGISFLFDLVFMKFGLVNSS